MVTFPDDTPTTELECLQPGQLTGVTGELALTNGHHLNAIDTVKFEEKRMTSASKTKVITDGYSSEQVGLIPHHPIVRPFQLMAFPLQATSNSAEMKRLQTGDIDYKEASAASAIRNKIEVDGITAEQNAAVIKVCKRLRFALATADNINGRSIGANARSCNRIHHRFYRYC